MKVSSSEPGKVVSSFAHVAALAAALIGFSDTRKLEDPQESVPVELLTDQQFNQITHGDKTAKDVKPQPVKADRTAELEQPKPAPTNEAKVDVPTPPPPLKRIPDPGDDDAPTPPTPPKRVAALPPPPPPTPPKPDPKPEPPKPEAEAIEPPKPPPRPKPPTPQPPKDEAKPKPDQKPLDKLALAKLLDEKAPPAPKPASRPKSGDETSETHRLNPDAVSKLLSREPPGQRPSTAHALSQVASLGAASANAAKMSPSMWGQLDALLQDQYKQCWSYLGLGEGQRYIPQIKVEYAVDGALVGQPALLNPPGDPSLRSLAESAMRAVRRCNPLRIPSQFAPYFEQWKARILRFDPEEMSG